MQPYALHHVSINVSDVDDEDVLHIAAGDVPPELADGVRRAVESCPKTALRIEE